MFETVPAKVMLFGEYGVIHGGASLNIPFPRFSGHLDYSDLKEPRACQSHKTIQAFINFLTSHSQDEISHQVFDLSRIKKELKRGLFFNSSIPVGYGLGSSGALCAALYRAYSQGSILEPINLASLNLKKSFSMLESYFHSRSSGIDPLVCFVNKPLLFEGASSFRSVNLSQNHFLKTMFLIDTGVTRKTAPFVKWFLCNWEQQVFRDMILEQYIPSSDACIKYYLAEDQKKFWHELYHVSHLQREYFGPMVLPEFMEIWKQGLSSNKYLLKLCGAGGGGFLLGFVQDRKELEQLKKKNSFKIITL